MTEEEKREHDLVVTNEVMRRLVLEPQGLGYDPAEVFVLLEGVIAGSVLMLEHMTGHPAEKTAAMLASGVPQRLEWAREREVEAGGGLQ